MSIYNKNYRRQKNEIISKISKLLKLQKKQTINRNYLKNYQKKQKRFLAKMLGTFIFQWRPRRDSNPRPAAFYITSTYSCYICFSQFLECVGIVQCPVEWQIQTFVFIYGILSV